MTPRRVSRCAVLSLLLLVGVRVASLRAGEVATPAVEFFEKKVRPVLVEQCYRCHSASAKKLKGGLRLDSRAALLKGGDSGPALVPGQVDKSRLIEAISYRNVELQMPPRGKLSDAAIADLAAWVKMGAPWPGQDAETVAVRKEFDLGRRKREHWAWQPVRPQLVPVVRDPSWVRGPVDGFIRAKLEAKGLEPAPAADRRTLLRRLSFDLVGLPPTVAEVEAFVHDNAPDAYEKVVDRLLASPHFGERWGRHWLDLVRYAESRGHEFDFHAPNAYHYRDYVIRALNADLPYDQFVVEHLAGDLLPHPRRHPHAGFNESILGTGFWFLGEEVHSPVDVRQDEADRLDNMVDVMGKTFLGLTIACARCHDHKFDAISTKDYYSLFGFVESSSYRLARFDTMEQERRVAAELAKLRERARREIQKALADAVRPGAEHLADYLLAARAVLLAGRDADVKSIAAANGVDAAVLGRWVAHLKAAARDASDPFHAWAKAACDPGAGDPKRLADLLRPLVEDGKRRTAQAATALKGAEVIVDYSRPGPDGFLPDGVAFGTAPAQAGDLCVTGDARQPKVHIVEHAAAIKDAVWDRLRPAPGAENDPGALGAVWRAGRTIRTPSFTVNGGRVFSLVRGNAFVYAAVNSHHMIAGPLHGRLTSTVRVGDRFHWIAHDLSVYRGQRAHLEFTPLDGSDFAVALVVQAPAPPGDLEGPNQALLKVLAGDEKAAAPSVLALGYQRLLLDVVIRLAEDRVRGSADHARLASWLVKHADLFGTAEKSLADAARPFVEQQTRLLATVPAESRLCMALLDGSGHDEQVFVRGSPKVLGERVPRRFLEAVAGPERLPVERGSGRLELARLMTDPARNPFLARVLVNRVWHHLFGRGLVASVDNFGVLGEAPTHPELLDYLADRFVQEGWSIKKLIRMLVLTNTYRMVSTPGGPGDEVDPENLLLHRMRLRRLEGEALRDAMLALSGRLQGRLYGRSVPVYLNAFQEGRGRPASGPLDGDGRRSLYLSVRRNFLSSLLLAFDTPSPFSTVGRRTVSNVPAQALILMNDDFVQQQARLWAERVRLQPGSASERVVSLYESAFARPPSERELGACLEFVKRQARLGHTSPEAVEPWADLAHVLLNVKEFIFLN